MSRSIGVLLSFALHALLLGLLVQHERPKDSSSLGDPKGDASTPIGSLILVSIARSPEEDPLRSFAVPAALLASITLPQVVEPALGPLHNEAAEQASGSAPTESEAAAQLAMFGRYSAQTIARIDRAWIHPQSEIQEREFQCTVRVRQNLEGMVLSTELVDCNGDSRWQESLVFAIEQASPLPAPPDPSVFSEELMLTFTAPVANRMQESSRPNAL